TKPSAARMNGHGRTRGGVRPSLVGRGTGLKQYATVSIRESPMSVQSAQFDPSAAADLQRAAYWNNPADPQGGHHHGPDATGSDAPAPRSIDVDGGDSLPDRPDTVEQQAVAIDGTATNSGERTTRSTPDGKPILVDPLHRDGQVGIARERTNAGGYVSSDQLVFTTGSRDDAIGVKQRDDGTLDVNVNGESY